MRISDHVLRQVGEANVIPRGYGFAWYNSCNRSGTYFPIPFNLFLRFSRWFYFWLVYVSFPLAWEKEKLVIEQRAYRLGVKEILQEETRKAERRKTLIQKRIDELEKSNLELPHPILTELVIPLMKSIKELYG